LALIVGLAAGWFLRGEVAIDTCLDMGGKWWEPGLCRDATKFLLN
jgi:hypothetical protein